MNRLAIRAALSTAVLAFLAGTPTSSPAQTAADINRLNAAIQICNSGLGATPECARLRGQLGGGRIPGGGVPAGVGGGKAAAAAGIFSLLSQAQAQAAPAPAATSAVNPAAIQQAITTCVQNARGNETAIQACLRIADAAKGPSPSLGALR